MLNHLRQFIFGHGSINPTERLRWDKERLQPALNAQREVALAEDNQNRYQMRVTFRKVVP